MAEGRGGGDDSVDGTWREVVARGEIVFLVTARWPGCGALLRGVCVKMTGCGRKCIKKEKGKKNMINIWLLLVLYFRGLG